MLHNRHIFQWITAGLLAFGLKSYSHEGHYAISVGVQEIDRLSRLDDIYFPYTRSFVENRFIKEGQRLLDLGCGTGTNSLNLLSFLKEKGSILAIDLHQKQIDTAKTFVKSKNITFLKKSAYDLENLNCYFDIVYSRFLFCHLEHLEKVLKQVKKVLKPGGYLIIEDLVGNDTFYSNPSTVAMSYLHLFDKYQKEIEKSDDNYFLKLPKLLAKEGFNVLDFKISQPKLNTANKRKMLSDNLFCLKDSLIKENKISLEEFKTILPLVQNLEKDDSIEIFSYAFGQICARYGIP